MSVAFVRRGPVVLMFQDFQLSPTQKGDEFHRVPGVGLPGDPGATPEVQVVARERSERLQHADRRPPALRPGPANAGQFCKSGASLHVFGSLYEAGQDIRS